MLDFEGALDALLRRVVREELQGALAATAEPLPALLTADQLARELAVSVATIRRLRRDGLPTILVGESPRFRLIAVLAWFDSTGNHLRVVK